jgi:predicted kinase
VWVHTKWVTEELVASEGFRSENDDDREALFWCGPLHDVAKPDTRTVNLDGSISNPSHSRIGAIDARRILWELGMDFEIRERVCAIIATHQIPFWLVSGRKIEETREEKEAWEREARRILLATSLAVPNRMLATFAEADARGRICPNRQDVVDNVELFRMAAQDEGCFDEPFEFFSDANRFEYFRSRGARDPSAAIYDASDHSFAVTTMVGLPGSGKSTWVSHAVQPGGELEGQPVVSLDALRIEMKLHYGDNQGSMIQEAMLRCKKLLAAKKPFVFDATNLSKNTRGQWTSLFADYGARVSIVYVETTHEEFLCRNRSMNDLREVRIPESGLVKMLHAWQVPQLDECHELKVVHTGPTPSRKPREGTRFRP